MITHNMKLKIFEYSAQRYGTRIHSDGGIRVKIICPVSSRLNFLIAITSAIKIQEFISTPYKLQI